MKETYFDCFIWNFMFIGQQLNLIALILNMESVYNLFAKIWTRVHGVGLVATRSVRTMVSVCMTAFARCVTAHHLRSRAPSVTFVCHLHALHFHFIILQLFCNVDAFLRKRHWICPPSPSPAILCVCSPNFC